MNLRVAGERRNGWLAVYVAEAADVPQRIEDVGAVAAFGGSMVGVGLVFGRWRAILGSGDRHLELAPMTRQRVRHV